MRCDKCKHWIPSNHNTYFLPENYTGECTGMKFCDKVEFNVKAGWDGGYVNSIETDNDFFCAEFEEKE